jgi:hypothetical protein
MQFARDVRPLVTTLLRVKIQFSAHLRPLSTAERSLNLLNRPLHQFTPIVVLTDDTAGVGKNHSIS